MPINILMPALSLPSVAEAAKAVCCR